MINQQQLLSGLVKLETRGREIRGSNDVLTDIDFSQANAWLISCKTYIRKVFGENSEYYAGCVESNEDCYRLVAFERALEILSAARRDCEDGLLVNLKKRIQAETFDEFLDLSERLLEEEPWQVSAVVAGAVLESVMRKMCADNGIELGRNGGAEEMRNKLKNASVINEVMHKRLLTLLQTRHDAAHNRWERITKEDAKELLDWTRHLVEQYES